MNIFETEIKMEYNSIADDEFRMLSQLIYNKCGITLNKNKKIMLEGRLRRRIKATGKQNYNDYINYLFSDTGYRSEIVHFINAVTTNTSDFFREPGHFEFLKQSVLPELLGRDIGKNSQMRILSAGCSTGEEPYTAAIVLLESQENNESIDFKITGTDISTEVLNKASLGIFSESQVTKIPLDLKKKYFLRGKANHENFVRVNPQLRSLVNFQKANLIDRKTFPAESYDVVFCRNVLIYFNKTTQEHVLLNISKSMRENSYLFIGHSETISGMNLPFRKIGPTVYIKV